MLRSFYFQLVSLVDRACNGIILEEKPEGEFKMANVAIHVTGGIATYKIVSLVREFQKHGDVVRVAMTDAAEKFVTATTFSALTKYPTLTSLWSEENADKIAHIELADWTDLAVIAPATANVIGKLANGIADDAVTTTLTATAARKVIVPAMNSHMWSNPAVKRNITQLIRDGYEVMPPVSGRLAEGYSGTGRMPEVNDIFAFVTQATKPILKDKKVLISAGGTREQIDPVRFIGNRSSGKMGIALANAAANAGAEVTLVVGQITVLLPTHPQIKIIHIESTNDLFKTISNEFTQTDILIMAAAVADFEPETVATQKIKKSTDNDEFLLKLKKTPDILKTVGATKKDQLVVGFAAETQGLLANAQKKLIKKNADLIIANNVATPGIGFASDDNQVTLLERDQDPKQLPKMTKNELAAHLIKLIATKIN